MGLFSRNNAVCSICGENAGMGSKTIIDGKICRQCCSKLSSQFNHYSNMTVDDVRSHLKYRADNLAKLKEFRPTRILLTARHENEEIYGGKVYVDENRRTFLFSETNDYLNRNVNLFKYSEFKSFSYNTENSYILIKILAFSKECNSIIEQEFEWDLDIPDAFRRKPKESPEYKEAVAIVQDTEKFFNAMLENSSESAGYIPINVRCPNCGAITAANGRTVTCTYCGSSFINTLYE